MTAPFFTIGHSNRSLEEFIGLLRVERVEQVVDVRRLPGSARYPQFDADVLEDALAGAGIRYRRAEGLTGRRPVSRDIPFEVNAWWENRSFHNYADYALSELFRAALAELRETPARTAVMCSEAVWWRCHRRIIADYLLAGGARVVHILGAHRTEPATLSLGAVAGDDGITYPAIA